MKTRPEPPPSTWKGSGRMCTRVPSVSHPGLGSLSWQITGGGPALTSGLKPEASGEGLWGLGGPGDGDMSTESHLSQSACPEQDGFSFIAACPRLLRETLETQQPPRGHLFEGLSGACWLPRGPHQVSFSLKTAQCPKPTRTVDLAGYLCLPGPVSGPRLFL